MRKALESTKWDRLTLSCKNFIVYLSLMLLTVVKKFKKLKQTCSMEGTEVVRIPSFHTKDISHAAILSIYLSLSLGESELTI